MLLSLVEVVDSITVSRSSPDEDLTKITSFNFACRLVSNWVRSDPKVPERGYVRLGLILPDGTQAPYSDPVDLNMIEYPRGRIAVNVLVLPFRGEGRYEFLVELQQRDSWNEVARLPIDVVLATAE
jgi:hypothetical protein